MLLHPRLIRILHVLESCDLDVADLSIHVLDAVNINCIDNVAGRGIDCDLAGDATSFGLCAEKEAVITRILLCVLSNLAVRMCNRSHPGVLGTQRKVQILANALGAA